jgi:hypothetical protein
MEQADLESVKQQVYNIRERVFAVRSLLTGDSSLERAIEQDLFEAEYFLDQALGKLDPNLVS